MRLRLELFVADVAASVGFYTEVLGFEVTRRGPDYVSIRNGAVVLGLGPAAKLPERGDGPGFTQQRLTADRGAGVEIVLELDDVDELKRLHHSCQARGVLVEALRDQPWGLRDFRLADPDGYYLRVTHGNAAAAEADAATTLSGGGSGGAAVGHERSGRSRSAGIWSGGTDTVA